MLSFQALDHFIVSRELFYGAINSYFSIHDADNTSDHVPICMLVCMVVDGIKFAPRHRVPKPTWYKASDRNISSYKICLLKNLSDLDIPFIALCRIVLILYRIALIHLIQQHNKV